MTIMLHIPETPIWILPLCMSCRTCSGAYILEYTQLCNGKTDSCSPSKIGAIALAVLILYILPITKAVPVPSASNFMYPGCSHSNPIHSSKSPFDSLTNSYCNTLPVSYHWQHVPVQQDKLACLHHKKRILARTHTPKYAFPPRTDSQCTLAPPHPSRQAAGWAIGAPGTESACPRARWVVWEVNQSSLSTSMSLSVSTHTNNFGTKVGAGDIFRTWVDGIR
jgi:hypothetical protein